MNTPVTVTPELSDSQALVLAQFVKRRDGAEGCRLRATLIILASASPVR